MATEKAKAFRHRMKSTSNQKRRVITSIEGEGLSIVEKWCGSSTVKHTVQWLLEVADEALEAAKAQTGK